MKNIKKLLIASILLMNISFLFAQVEEDYPWDGKWFTTYNLGTAYTYAFDLPTYKTIPLYQLWQEAIKDISPNLIDNLGQNGHILQITNQLEWRKDNFSITAFANLNLNHIPAFFDVSKSLVPACIKGGLECFKVAANVWQWAVKDGWILFNILTLFSCPIIVSGCCIFAGAICFLALPVAVACLAIPMVSLGGSFDYHPYTNKLLDTKLSAGIDIDGYRGLLHCGWAGFFTQAEAILKISNIRIYTQAGYRIDALNVSNAIKTARGLASDGKGTKYIPAPYLRAGASWCFGQY